MKITVLVENSLCENPVPALKTEHGLSVHIEIGKTNILFDVGQSDLFAKNAQELGIDISNVDYLIISHGHFDHGGGLKKFFELNEKAEVFMHRDAIKKHFTMLLGIIPYDLGLNKKIINKFKDRITFIDKKTPIGDSIMIIEDFPENFPQPTGNLSLYEKQSNKKVYDAFKHEIALLINEKENSTLFTGCSHSGIMNMIAKAEAMNKGKNIDFVFGGFHVHNPVSKKNESKAYLQRLIGEMEKTNSIYYTGHCTGKSNFDFIKNILADKIHSMNTGDRIVV
jgi:7,8-dihydropterin-6-yl-methyl-4-(beta-D-ribofuranosyl)aminobenzene 5'-phosphate synthase